MFRILMIICETETTREVKTLTLYNHDIDILTLPLRETLCIVVLNDSFIVLNISFIVLNHSFIVLIFHL